MKQAGPGHRGGNSTRIAALAATCALAAVAAGCGSDPETLDGRTLRVRMEEYKLIPQDVRARAGRLRIVAFNAGRQTHNVKVVKEAEDSEDAPLEIGGAKTAQPGATETATVRLRPGTYRIVCTIANHDDLGQYGELEVVP